MDKTAAGAARHDANGHANVNKRSESDVYEHCVSALQAAQAKDQAWFARFEDIDTSVCSRDELLALLSGAPTGFTAGFLFGKFAMRNEMAEVTGRPFE